MEFIVNINGELFLKQKAGSPRVAIQEALKFHPEFGMRGIFYGGHNRQLDPGETLYVTVCRRADRLDIKFKDEE